jgi:hypothetical protein
VVSFAARCFLSTFLPLRGVMEDGSGGLRVARQYVDIGSKWLLHYQGKAALLLGGLKGVRRLEPMPGEIAQSRRFPDGLFRAYLAGEKEPHHVLIEVATYSEKRALKQAVDDLALAYSVLGHLPELLMLVLRPKGRFRIEGKHEVRSKLGLSCLGAEWKAVEVWTLPAAEYLESGAVGGTPWVTLMDFDGPPEALLERCAEKIERQAHPKDRADLLAISQLMAQLRFPDPELFRLLGGEQTMIESPLLQQMIAEARHEGILDILKDRFGTVPRDVTRHLRSILDDKKLRRLNVLAGQCPDLQTFREELLS